MALENVRIVQASASEEASFAVSAHGALFSWGVGRGCVLGHDEKGLNEPYPTVVALDECIVHAEGSAPWKCLAVTSDGRTYSWGVGARGQLGHGHECPVVRPTLIEELSSVSVVAVSGSKNYASYAVAANGTAYGWGNREAVVGDDPHRATNCQRDYLRPSVILQRSDLRVISLVACEKSWYAITDTGECWSRLY